MCARDNQILAAASMRAVSISFSSSGSLTAIRERRLIESDIWSSKYGIKAQSKYHGIWYCAGAWSRITRAPNNRDTVCTSCSFYLRFVGHSSCISRNVGSTYAWNAHVTNVVTSTLTITAATTFQICFFVYWPSILWLSQADRIDEEV